MYAWHAALTDTAYVSTLARLSLTTLRRLKSASALWEYGGVMPDRLYTFPGEPGRALRGY